MTSKNNRDLSKYTYLKRVSAVPVDILEQIVDTALLIEASNSLIINEEIIAVVSEDASTIDYKYNTSEIPEDIIQNIHIEILQFLREL